MSAKIAIARLRAGLSPAPEIGKRNSDAERHRPADEGRRDGVRRVLPDRRQQHDDDQRAHEQLGTDDDAEVGEPGDVHVEVDTRRHGVARLPSVGAGDEAVGVVEPEQDEGTEQRAEELAEPVEQQLAAADRRGRTRGRS